MKLTEQDKKDMLRDAHSRKRRDFFRKLRERRYEGFSLQFLEQITKAVKVKYPRRFMKTDKNKL